MFSTGFGTKVKLKTLVISLGISYYPKKLWPILASKSDQGLNFIQSSETIGYFDCHLIVFTYMKEGNKHGKVLRGQNHIFQHCMTSLPPSSWLPSPGHCTQCVHIVHREVQLPLRISV